jgi:hypothetical protein
MSAVLDLNLNAIGDGIVADARTASAAAGSGARAPVRLDLNALRVVNWEQQWGM